MDAEILPALPVTDLEEALRRSMSRTLTIDSPRWISFLRRAYENLPINPTPTEKKYLRMWAITLFPDGQKDSPKDPALAINRFAKKSHFERAGNRRAFSEFHWDEISVRDLALSDDGWGAGLSGNVAKTIAEMAEIYRSEPEKFEIILHRIG